MLVELPTDGLVGRCWIRLRRRQWKCETEVTRIEKAVDDGVPALRRVLIGCQKMLSYEILVDILPSHHARAGHHRARPEEMVFLRAVNIGLTAEERKKRVETFR